MGETKSECELVLGGLGDQSTETRQRVAQVLTDNFGLSESAAQVFLDRAPITIKRADSADELETFKTQLEEAGAFVTVLEPEEIVVVKEPKTEPSTAETDDVSFTIEFEEDEVEEPDIQEPEPQNESVQKAPPIFELAPLEDDEPQLEPEVEEKPEPKAESKGTPIFEFASGSYEPEQDDKTEPDEKSATEKDSTLGSDLALSLDDTPAEETEKEIHSEETKDPLPEETKPESPTFDFSLDEPNEPEPEADLPSEEVPTGKILSMEQTEASELDLDTEPNPETPAIASEEENVEEVEASVPPTLESSDNDLIETHDLPEQLPEQDEISPSPEEQPQLTPPPPETRASSGISRNTQVSVSAIVLLGVCVMALGMANYIYFSKTKASQTVVIPDFSDPSAFGKSKAKPKKTPPPKPPEILKWEGEQLGSNGSVTAQVTTSDGLPSDFSIIIEDLPEPASLTSQQIVRKEARHPWLRKIHITSLTFKERKDGSFMGKGKAKTFIEYKNGNNRILADTVVSGKIREDKSEMSLNIAIQKDYSKPPKNKNMEIEVLTEGSFKLFYSNSIWLSPKKVEEEEELE